jgi:hypothetical protein
VNSTATHYVECAWLVSVDNNVSTNGSPSRHYIFQARSERETDSLSREDR